MTRLEDENKEIEDFAIKIKNIKGSFRSLELLRFHSVLQFKSEENKINNYDVWDTIRASSTWGTLTTHRRYLIKALGLSKDIFLKSFYNLTEEDKIKIVEYSNALKRVEGVNNNEY